MSRGGEYKVWKQVWPLLLLEPGHAGHEQASFAALDHALGWLSGIQAECQCLLLFRLLSAACTLHSHEQQG